MQSFESDKVARDYAALLALFHFQKTLPLERKLPEPYSSTWTSMVNSAKAEEAAVKKSAFQAKKGKVATSSLHSTSTPTSDASCTSISTSISPLDSSSSVVKTIIARKFDPVGSANESISIRKSECPKESTDFSNSGSKSEWPCDECGAINFATLASGLPRIKCFKCQALRINTGFTSIQADAKHIDKKRDVDGDKKLKKTPPVAVLNLKAQSQFASQAARQRSELEKKASKRTKDTYHDALRRANRPTPILMSPSVKKVLETVLKINPNLLRTGVVEGYPSDDMVLEQNLSDIYVELEAEDVELVSDVDCGIQREVAEDVTLYLHDQGFNLSVILMCLRYLVANPRDIQLKYDKALKEGKKENKDTLYTLVREKALEYLCLNMVEDDLPEVLSKCAISMFTRLHFLYITFIFFTALIT